MDFGFTNDDKEYQRVLEYRKAVMNDGWVSKPRYNNEPIESYSEHHKEGFILTIGSRKKVGKWKYECDISIWGPDQLAVAPPLEYNWEEILERLTRCDICKETGIPVQRVAFANRVCKNCLPEARKKLESPGWCD